MGEEKKKKKLGYSNPMSIHVYFNLSAPKVPNKYGLVSMSMSETSGTECPSVLSTNYLSSIIEFHQMSNKNKSAS